MERKSWTHVLKVVGYRRFDTTGELRLLSEICAALWRYKNFCPPTIRMKSKTRLEGSILWPISRTRGLMGRTAFAPCGARISSEASDTLSPRADGGENTGI